MEKLPLDWNQVSLTFFKVFDKNTSKIETTEEHLHCWPCRLSWKKSTVQNLSNRLPSLHHSASYLAVWWWKMGQKTDNQKAVEMSKYKKPWYLYTNERFWYIWQQNENQINPISPKDQNENKMEGEVFPPSTTFNSWYWRKGKFQVRGGYGLVETVSIWFPAAPTAGDRVGLLTAFSQSLLLWTWMWFWFIIHQSIFLKNKGKTRGFTFPPLPYLSQHLALSQMLHMGPFRCSIFPTVLQFSSKQEITTKSPQLSLQDANKLM